MKDLLIYLMILSFFFSCKEKKDKENNDQGEAAVEVQSSVVNPLLLAQIYWIKEFYPNDSLLFYDVYFSKKNNDMYLNIILGFSPPYFLENHKCIGFINIKNNYLLFFGEKNDSILNSFVSIDSLNTDFTVLEKMQTTNMLVHDPNVYVYKIYLDSLSLQYIKPI